MKFSAGLSSPAGGASTEKDKTTGKVTKVKTFSGGPMHLFGVEADFQPLPPRNGMDRLKQLFTNKTALGFIASIFMGPLSVSHERGPTRPSIPRAG